MTWFDFTHHKKTVAVHNRFALAAILTVLLSSVIVQGASACLVPDPSDSAGPARPWQAAAAGPLGDGCETGRPHDSINTFTGNLTIYDTPVSYQNIGQPMPFTVVFNSQSGRTGSLGDRWTHSFNWYLINNAPYGITVVDGFGGETYFTGSGSVYEAPAGVFDVLAPNAGGWSLTKPDNTLYCFNSSGRLFLIKDEDDFEYWFAYDQNGLLTTATDPVGRITTFNYVNGRLSRVTVPGGLHADFAYDIYNRLSAVTDATNTDTYTYGYEGTRIISITDPSGSQARYDYDTFDTKTVLVSSDIANVPGSVVDYDYVYGDGTLLFTRWDLKGGALRQTLFEYDKVNLPGESRYYGTVHAIVKNLGGISARNEFTYDSEHRTIQYIDSFEPEQSGQGHAHHFEYTDPNNPSRVTKYIDPENAVYPYPGYVTRYVWPNGPVFDVTTPEGRVTEFGYRAGTFAPTFIKIKDADFNGNPVDRTTSFNYYPNTDPIYRRNRVQSVTDARGNVTTFYYDANGYPDYIDPPLGNNVDMTANSVGDITAVTDGNGNTTSYQYDNLHRLTQITFPDVGSGQKTRTFAWTCCGLDQVTDENGRVTKYEYYSYTKRLWKVHEDYAGLNYITTYTYDEPGNVIAVTNARGKTTYYTYDGLDRRTRADYPDGTYETWAYRDDGRVYQHRDGRGFVTNYHYDADDRPATVGTLKAVDYPNMTDVGIVRDKDGLITSFIDATGTSSMVYYPSTWLKSQTNGAGRTVTLEYNGVGEVASVTAPGVGATTYAYNALNQVTSVTNALGLSSTLSYRSTDSKLQRITRPGSYVQYAYNARGWPTQIVNYTTGGAQFYYTCYCYTGDNVGNPIWKREYTTANNLYATTRYWYDGIDRLTREQRTGTNPCDTSYGYDQVGNRLSLTLNGVVTNYSYDDNDKLLTATSGGNSAGFGYDGAGNMLSVTGNLFGARTMVYDDESRLTSVTFPGGTDTFTYNAFGQKMGANLEGLARTYTWFGARLIAEHSSCHPECAYAGAIYTDGSYGGLWLGRQMGSQKQYPVYDGIGTVHQVVNETPAVLFTNDLDAFGHAIAGSGSATWHPYRFGGAWGYTTMPSGLEQLGARFYWPELGRFIQQDPMGDGVNWYAYAGNNPLRWADPTGLGFVDSVKAAVVFVVSLPDRAVDWVVEEVAQTFWDPVKVDVPNNGGAELGRGEGFDAREATKACLIKPAVVVGAAAAGNAAEAAEGVNPAFATARAGGRHAGTLKNYAGRSAGEIAKAIRGYERQVAAHQQKIANPAKYAENWGKMSAEQQAGLIGHWQQDLNRNQEIANVLRGLLASR